jgi:ribosomal protein S18 acetylase RimI-like enzyme
MVPSLSTLSAPLSDEELRFRNHVSIRDRESVDRIVRQSGVFNADEIAIARELLDEHLAKGPEASGYYFLFAEGPAGLLGYTCYGPIPGTKGRFELYWITVDPHARRLRLGEKLQRASEEAARAMGAVFMVAETSTRPDYAPAHNFYRAQGYRLLAEIPDWHDDGDGLAIFGKRL